MWLCLYTALWYGLVSVCVYIVNIGCGIICGYFYRYVCYGCGKGYLYLYMYVADTGYGILCV